MSTEEDTLFRQLVGAAHASREAQGLPRAANDTEAIAWWMRHDSQARRLYDRYSRQVRDGGARVQKSAADEALEWLHDQAARLVRTGQCRSHEDALTLTIERYPKVYQTVGRKA